MMAAVQDGGSAERTAPAEVGESSGEPVADTKSNSGTDAPLRMLSAWLRSGAFLSRPMLLLGTSMLAVGFASAVLIYVVEPRGNLPDFPDAVYFVAVAASTTGYGDICAATTAGKILICVIVAGCLSISSATGGFLSYLLMTQGDAGGRPRQSLGLLARGAARAAPHAALPLAVGGASALLLAGLIFAAEPRENLPSFSDALYLTAVTATTVGFGDVTAATAAGRCLSAVAAVVGPLCGAAGIGATAHGFAAAAGHPPLGEAAAAPRLARAAAGHALRPLALVAGAYAAALLLMAAAVSGAEAQIQSYWEALYVLAVTVTTVGYGDILPATEAGRAVVAIAAILGFLHAALLSGIAVYAFAAASGTAGRFASMREVSAALARAMISVSAVLAVHMGLFLVSSVLFYAVEPEDNVDSFQTALWLGIATATSVGFGDVTPASVAGRALVVFIFLGNMVTTWISSGLLGYALQQSSLRARKVALTTGAAK